MATIEIDTGGGEILSLEAEDTERVLDLCDEASLPHLFSCRAANCGVCLVEVVDGASLLEAPREPERVLLRRLGADAAPSRLGCQIRVVPASGVVRLRFADRRNLSTNRA